MNAPSRWLGPLQLLAVGLGVAIIVLLVLWVRLEPPPQAASVQNEKHPDQGIAPDLASRPEPSGPPATGSPTKSAMPREAAASQGASAVLYGAVRRADGEPIKRGVFWLYRDGKHVATESPKNGSYAFASLRAGDYHLRSRIDDELPLNRDIVVAPPSTRLDIDLPARWLLTVNAVTPEGQPLLDKVREQARNLRRRGITACAFRAPLPGDLPPSNLAEVSAGLGPFRGGDLFPAAGKKALPKQTIGILTLPADEPVHVALLMRNHVVAQLPATPGQAEVTFTIAADAFLAQMATVRVRLVDRSGAPVIKARVSLNDAQTGGGGVQTGEDGRATLRYLKPGRLDLEIGHRRLRAPPLQVDVTAGADLDLGDVIMLPPIRVELAMDNFGGKGSVRLNWLGTPPTGMTFDDRYVSNESGTSRSLSLYPGRYGMLASAPNGVTIVEVDLRMAPAAPIRFDLRPGAPLRIDTRVGSSFARLELCSRSGVLVRRRELTGSRSETVQLPPGEYTATITDATGAVTRRTIALTRAGTTLTIR